MSQNQESAAKLRVAPPIIPSPHFEVHESQVHSQPQDVGDAQSVSHSVPRGWSAETNNTTRLPEKHGQLADMTPLQRWQAEPMRDQPYHNMQALIVKEQNNSGEPSQPQGSSVGYIDSSDHQHGKPEGK